jgi:hypothetical protein
VVEIEYGVGMSTTIVVFKVLVDMSFTWMYRRGWMDLLKYLVPDVQVNSVV